MLPNEVAGMLNVRYCRLAVVLIREGTGTGIVHAKTGRRSFRRSTALERKRLEALTDETGVGRHQEPVASDIELLAIVIVVDFPKLVHASRCGACVFRPRVADRGSRSSRSVTGPRAEPQQFVSDLIRERVVLRRERMAFR